MKDENAVLHLRHLKGVPNPERKSGWSWIAFRRKLRLYPKNLGG